MAGGGTLAFGIIGVWSGDEKFFHNFLTPVFNRVDPELSHRSAVFVAKHNLIRAAPPDEELNLVSIIFPQSTYQYKLTNYPGDNPNLNLINVVLIGLCL